MYPKLLHTYSVNERFWNKCPLYVHNIWLKKKAIHNTQKKWKDKNAVPLNQSNFSGRRLESLFPDKPNDISNYHSYILCRAYSKSMVPLFTNKPQELNLKSVVLVEIAVIATKSGTNVVIGFANLVWKIYNQLTDDIDKHSVIVIYWSWATIQWLRSEIYF